AAGAGVALDGGARVDDLELLAVRRDRQFVAADDRHDGERGAFGSPALAATAGVVEGDVARKRHGDRLAGALTGQRAPAEALGAGLDAVVYGRMNLDSHVLFPFLRFQNVTTLRIDSTLCIRSNASLILLSGITCVIRSSMLILPSMYQSTIFGTSVRPRAPPKAVPFHTRPVTSWNGR